MQYRDKFVDFFKYCKTCKYFDQKGYKDPCNECLENPVNEHSEKPINYVKREEKVKKDE